MKFKDDASSLLGNLFFEHYQLTMDWQNNRLILDPKKVIEIDTLDVFELIIAPDYNKNKLEVKGVWLDHELAESIEIGSVITKIDGEDVSNFTKEELCNYWDVEWIEINKREELSIEVEFNELKQMVRLKKQVLLPK